MSAKSEKTPEELAESKKLAREIFNEFDTDKSGLIDAKDVKNVFTKWHGGRLSEDQVESLTAQFFEQTDANADKKVTFEEVYDAILKGGGISFHLVG